MSPALTITAATGLAPLPHPFPLALGGALENGVVAFEVAGPEGAPVVLVQGGISAGRHVASHPNDPRPGWWEAIVGPGKAIDTERFRVLALDPLGGAGASSGPASSGLGERFPRITTADQARAAACVLDRLGLGAMRAFVGASYGGMVGLSFARALPARLGRLVVLGAAHESAPMAAAWRSVQRGIVRFALRAGDGPAGVALARALAMTTYRSERELRARFGPPAPTPGGPVSEVEGYLASRGRALARRIDAAAYLALSEALDLHRIEPEEVRVPATVVCFDSDQLVPPWQARELASRLGGPCELVEISTPFGHDGFLKETEAVGRAVARALAGGEAER